MKRFKTLFKLGILSLLFLPAPSLAEQPGFVVVRPPIVKIYDAPSQNATVLFTSNQAIIFEVLDTSHNYYLIPLLNGFQGWIQQKNVKDYRGRIPPPPYRMGISHPVSDKVLDELAKKEAAKGNTPRPRSGRFRYPEIPSDFNLDVNGFFETKWSFRDFGDGSGGDISVNDPRWDTIHNDPIYKKIPRDVLKGDPQLNLRYQLNIEGEVDKDLTVRYNLEQEPDLPGKYDINVYYKQSQLTFYHYNESFVDGEFMTVRKALDGVRAKTYTDDWEAKIALGRQRSEPQQKLFVGNGQNTYSLGNSSILKDSLTIFVNNKKLSEKSDYTVDYFKGKVTFTTPPQKTDTIKAIYEFTNPIEDFIPALSRKNFVGAQFLWQPKSAPVTTKDQITVSETLWPTTASENATARFKLSNKPVVLGSDTVELNKKKLRRNKDYFIRHLRGEIELKNIRLSQSDELKIRYQAYRSKAHSDAFIGNDTPGPFALDYQFVILGTVDVTVDGKKMREGLDYDIDYQRGAITFEYAINYPYVISVDYEYVPSETKVPKKKDRPLSVGLTYVNESVRAEEQELKLTSIETVSPNSLGQASLSNTPVLDAEEIIATVKNGKVSPNIFSTDFPTTADDIEASLKANNYMTNDRFLTDTYDTFDSTFKGHLNDVPSLSENDKQTIFTALGGARDQAISINILNAYNGLIQLQSDNFATIPTATITYKYQKSFSTRFPFFVPEELDQEREYINDGSRGFRISNIPIKNNGITEIRYFPDGSDLTYSELRPGKEFDVDYQENDPDNPGEEVIVTFFKTGDRGESENLPDYPKQGERLIFFYDYAPKTDPNEGKLDQTMIGLTIRNKLSENWSVEGELVAAQNNFEKPRITEETTIQPSGENNESYSLGQTNIIEDSESVFVENANGTTQLRKGLDYIINYINGTIRFTEDPGVDNLIKVEFQYEDSSENTQGGTTTPFRYAAKVGTAYKDDQIDTSFRFKTIDKNFLPISPIKDKKGTTEIGGDFSYKINEDNNIKLDYDNRNIFIKTDTDGEEIFEQEQDISLSSETLLLDTFDTRIEARYFEEVQDKSINQQNVTESLHAVDNKLSSIKTETRFGNQQFSNFIAYSHAENESDFKDKKDLKNSVVDSIQAKSTISLSDLFLLGDVRLSPHYLLSQEETRSSAETNPFTTRETYGAGSTIYPFKGLKIDSSFDRGSIKSQGSTGSANLTIINNQKNKVAFSPYYWLSTSYSFDRRESESPYIGQSGNISETRSYRINRYSLHDMLTWSGLPRDNFLISPFKSSYFTYQESYRDSSENDNRKTYDKDSLNYSFNRFSPITGLSLDKISYREDTSLSFNDISNSTTSTNSTLRDFNHLSARIKYKPALPLLNLFTISKSLDQEEETRLITKRAFSGTDNITVEDNPETTEKLTVQFRATPLLRELNKWTRIDLGPMDFSYSDSIRQKNTSRNTTVSSNVANTPVSLSRIADNQYKNSRTLSGRVKPFNLIGFGFSIATANEILVRNLNSSTEGSTFKDLFNTSVSTGFSFIPGVNMAHSYSKNTLLQLRSPTINITRSTIEDSIGTETIPDNTSQLDNTVQVATTKWTISPLPKFDINIGATYKLIDQVFTTQNASTQEITQKIGSLGVTYYPLKELALSYQHDVKFNDSLDSKTQIRSESNGTTGTFKAQYTLFNQQNMKVSFDYDRVATQGQDLNTLDNQLSEQGSGDTLQLSISEQDNVIETGSLSVNITLPFKQSPYIDNLVITASGYVKKISDNINESNSYDISGLILKGTLNF